MIGVTEVTSTSLAYLMLGGFVVFFSLMSYVFKEKLFMGEAVLGTVFGILIGPYFANIFDPRSWGSTESIQDKVTLEVMRIVLATGLFTIGVMLPRAYLAKHAKSLLIMVVPTMAFGWIAVAALIKVLFSPLTLTSALAISACLTPTDPILSTVIVGGSFAIRYVPERIRHLISAESAANDGLAYPFLSLSLYLAIEETRREAIVRWLLVGCLYQVILGTVIGAVLGLVFSRLIHSLNEKKIIDRESYVVQYLALSIFTVGIVSSIGSDDLLAAFAAGSAFSWDGDFYMHTKSEAFPVAVDLFLNCVCFIYIGAWLPFGEFNAASIGIEPWRLTVLIVAIILIRRIPCILLLYRWTPDIKNYKEALFCGHFGPMGVSAIFVSTMAVTELQAVLSDEEGERKLQNEILKDSLHPIVGFVVLGSIVVHGLSISIYCLSLALLHLKVKVVSRTASLEEDQNKVSIYHEALPLWKTYTERLFMRCLSRSSTRKNNANVKIQEAQIEMDIHDKKDGSSGSVTSENPV